MTQDEAIKEIISKPKYYVGKMKQAKAASFVMRWRAGSAKQKSINNFLEAFGYKKVEEAKYSRRNE